MMEELLGFNNLSETHACFSLLLTYSFINMKKKQQRSINYVFGQPGRASKISRPAPGTKTPTHQLKLHTTSNNLETEKIKCSNQSFFSSRVSKTPKAVFFLQNIGGITTWGFVTHWDQILTHKTPWLDGFMCHLSHCLRIRK
jgi:hypothetical protein